MVDPKKAAKLIRQHFEELTTEQFVENLHRSCPEIFEDNQQSSEINSSSFISDEVESTKPISKSSH
ncbi:MAG: hypothetical protein AAFQ80_23285 [Cyanobacteria bacterium J06621_8]